MKVARLLPLLCIAIVGCGSGSSSSGGGGSASNTTAFRAVSLVSDQAGAGLMDTNLVNPWGIAIDPAGGFWISDNGRSMATIYTGGAGGSQIVNTGLTVAIPGGTPTGQVFNSTPDFVITAGAVSGPATFLFASESGQISGWSQAFGGAYAAQTIRTIPGAVYKGLAIGNNGTGNFLYAANLAAGRIDVFNKNFTPVTLTGTFTDPALPAGFAPFNIQNLGRMLFVTYAKQDRTQTSDVPGAGNGFVDVFDTDGNLLRRLVSQGALNSPWGLIIAPANFGKFSNALLVGNFGDGIINAYDANTGTSLGALQDNAGNPIVIHGLWGLILGNGVNAGERNALYFTAGPGGEQHGVFGRVDIVQ